MEYVLGELWSTANRLNVPLVIAGDLFDKPKPSVKLVRMAWDALKSCKAGVYAVAGQHDLPNHSMEYFNESGLGLLAATGCVKMLDDSPTFIGNHVALYGMNWGNWYPNPKTGSTQTYAVLIAHDYCWKAGHTYPGAPENKHSKSHWLHLESMGYKSAVFGDNHSGFEDIINSVPTGLLVNNGIVIPRNADFHDYQPHYTLLYDDGTLEWMPLKEKPQWQPWVANGEAAKKVSKKLLDFAKDVATLVGNDTKENFLDELELQMKKLDDDEVRKKVWDIITKAQESLR